MINAPYTSQNSKTVYCIIISSHSNGNYNSSDNAYPLVNDQISGTKIAIWEEKATLRDEDNQYLHTFVSVWEINLSTDDTLTCSGGLRMWIMV